MSEDSEDQSFLIALGHLTINWNFAEAWLRTLLASLVKQPFVGDILTTELGAVGIENALGAFATHVVSEDQGNAMKHAAKLYGRLRGYRNYYIHGTIYHLDGTDTGHAVAHSAKGSLKKHGARLKAFQITEMSQRCRALGMYVRQIHANVNQTPLDGGGPPPLPDMPPLPPEVDKNAPYPQSLSSQPQASAE